VVSAQRHFESCVVKVQTKAFFQLRDFRGFQGIRGVEFEILDTEYRGIGYAEVQLVGDACRRRIDGFEDVAIHGVSVFYFSLAVLRWAHIGVLAGDARGITASQKTGHACVFRLAVSCSVL
jgi:hypothetical protein